MTAVRTEDTIRVEPYGDYRNIFSILHAARALGDARVEPLLALLRDTETAFIKALSSFLNTAQQDRTHDEVIQFVGSTLKNKRSNATSFTAAVQPLLDHYPRMCNEQPKTIDDIVWNKRCSNLIRNLNAYPDHITDDLTSDQEALLLNASVAVMLADDKGNPEPIAVLVTSHHKLPDDLAELVLAYPDKADLMNIMLRSGNARYVEIESVLKGETPLPLADGVL